MIGKVSTFFRANPMLKGMAVYSVIWPTSSVVQQLINKDKLDFKKSLRFFVFGTFFVGNFVDIFFLLFLYFFYKLCQFLAPTLFCWVKVKNRQI